MNERGHVEHLSGRAAVGRTWICETTPYSICLCGVKKLLCAVPSRGIGALGGVDQFLLSRFLHAWLGVLGPLWGVERHEYVIDPRVVRAWRKIRQKEETRSLCPVALSAGRRSPRDTPRRSEVLQGASGCVKVRQGASRCFKVLQGASRASRRTLRHREVPRATYTHHEAPCPAVPLVPQVPPQETNPPRVMAMTWQGSSIPVAVSNPYGHSRDVDDRALLPRSPTANGQRPPQGET